MSESGEAHVLEFCKGCPPAWRVYPERRAESENEGGPGSGSEAVSGPGAVLAESGATDVPMAGRVFRVVICEACGWQYGSNWPRRDPVTWGDCPSCGGVTVIESGYRPDFRRAIGDKVRGAHGPRQLALGL